MSSKQVFHLPDLGEGLTEANLVHWLVSVGDKIVVDQPIAEVETAKSIVELPSPFAGVVTALHGEEGEMIDTGSPVLEVDASGGPAQSVTPVEPETSDPAASIELEAYRKEEQAGSGNVLIGYGTGAGPGKGRRRRRQRMGQQSPPAQAKPEVQQPETLPTETTEKPKKTIAVRSPIVRRLARELGVDPHTVTPTGSDGAITRSDVLKAADTKSDGGEAQSPEPTASRSASPTGPLNVLRTERFSPLRKAVSAKLSQSRSEIPEATVWVDVDVTELWNLRPRMAAPDQKPPSFTALFARYTLLALQEFPLLASRLADTGDELILFDGINLGVAVDTERGLMVPVLQRAETLNVSELHSSLRDLSSVAREGRTPPEQMRGSTFTLNNYGGFGVDGSAAIINHPDVAILGIGRVLEKPWVVNGEIVPRRIAQLSLVFDHRVCDGGYAARFLRTVVDLLENPLSAYGRL